MKRSGLPSIAYWCDIWRLSGKLRLWARSALLISSYSILNMIVMVGCRWSKVLNGQLFSYLLKFSVLKKWTLLFSVLICAAFVVIQILCFWRFLSLSLSLSHTHTHARARAHTHRQREREREREREKGGGKTCQINLIA